MYLRVRPKARVYTERSGELVEMVFVLASQAVPLLRKRSSKAGA